jgi:preprotein translocase subunit SecB
MAESKGPLTYPIQANFIAVRELYIKSNVPLNQRLKVAPSNFRMKTAHTAYDDERHVIEVGVQIEYGIETKPEEVVPFALRVHLMGQFQVDESQFKKEKIETWARINAPFILYPYLREHVYALTARAGLDPVLLPLMELPTIKMVRSPQQQTPEEGAAGIPNVQASAGPELVER